MEKVSYVEGLLWDGDPVTLTIQGNRMAILSIAKTYSSDKKAALYYVASTSYDSCALIEIFNTLSGQLSISTNDNSFTMSNTYADALNYSYIKL